ncbi:MAG: CDP-archaeol synthase [Thiohalobacterales bacterium]|nr:CDP-archaeol synthase [Thiohalobacterales bacterium]
MRIDLALDLFLLLIVANGTPAVLGILLRRRLAWPLDGGLKLPDGQRLLGPSKTVRGVLGSIALTALVAPAFGLDRASGALFALLAMAGDLVSSFTKRRLGYPSGSEHPLLDQLPETCLPLLLLQPVTGAGLAEMAVAIAAFTVVNLALTRLYLRLRRTPGGAG